MLWVSPLLIIIADSKFDVAGIILIDLLSYLQFPILFYLRTFSDTYYYLFLLVFSVKLGLLIYFAVQLLGSLIGDNMVFNYLKGNENRMTGQVGTD